MASEVKAQGVPVEDFSLLFYRYYRNAGPLPLGCTAGFPFRLQRPGCTKPLIEVVAVRPVAGTRRLPGLAPGASETHTFPAPALQDQRLALRRAGPFVSGSTRGQPRDKVGVADPLGPSTEPRRGPTQAREVGNAGARVHRGIGVPNDEFLAAPEVALVPACFRSANSSPARSAGLPLAGAAGRAG